MLEELDEIEGRKKARLRKLRWLLVAAIVVVAGGGAAVVALNAAASDDKASTKADAATADQAKAEDPGSQEAKADSEETDKDKKAPVPVEVAEIERGTVSAYISATANLVAEDDVRVLAEAEGRVARLAVEEGDRVSRGDVLAALDQEDEQIAFKKAQLRFENARQAYERSEDLFKKELVSREEHDRLKVDSDVASQELAEAQLALERTTIRAPIGGRVTARNIQIGQHVRPGDDLFQITDFDPLIARIFLPETDVLGLSEGRAVKLALNADPGVTFGGRIRQISPVVDTATGTVKVTIEAAERPAKVRPGSFVAVHIVRESRDDRVLLPKEAVIRELQASHVFVAKDDAAEKRTVNLGIEEGDWVEVVDGVDVGEKVIVAGQGGLRDGAAIKILDPSAQSAG